MMDRQLFFQVINRSLFRGKLNDRQRKGIFYKLMAFDKFEVTDVRWRAYMLATSYHETAQTMMPIEEWGRGRGKSYGRKMKLGRIKSITAGVMSSSPGTRIMNGWVIC